MKLEILALSLAALLAAPSCKDAKDNQVPAAPQEDASTVTGDEAVALGMAAAKEVMNALASTDSDSTSGSKEINELVPQLAEAAKQAPPDVAMSPSGQPGALVVRAARGQALGQSDLLGPATGPDGTDGWYYWEYTWTDSTWRMWMKCDPASDLRAGWPTGVTTWWYAWTGEAGSPLGYSYISQYTLLSRSHTKGTYRMQIKAPAQWAGSWSSGDYDWTSADKAQRDYTSYNNWKSHFLVGAAANDNYGRYESKGTSTAAGWGWSYLWYVGAGTTEDPAYASNPECPSAAWGTSSAGTGLVYWGQGTSQFEDGGWSGEYCSYKFDCTQQCYSYSKPLFTWDSACVRSVSVVQGDYESADESQAAVRWTAMSPYNTGAYIASPIKYNSAVAGGKSERNGDSLSSTETYTVIATKLDGSKAKKKFTGADRTVPLSLSGDTCGAVIGSVTLSPAEAGIVVAEHQKYVATAIDNYDNAIPSTFSWTSSDTAVAIIDPRGTAIGVAPGTTTITATLGAKRATAALTVGTAPVPSAPASVSASSGDQKLIISWASVEIATSYNLYWLAGASVTKLSGTKVTGVTLPYTLGGLTNGTTYAFAVSAVNATGESELSPVGTRAPRTSAPKSFAAALKVNDAGLQTSPSLSVDALALHGGVPYVLWTPMSSDISLDVTTAGVFGTDINAVTARKSVRDSHVLVAADGTIFIYYGENGYANVWTSPDAATGFIMQTATFPASGVITLCDLATTPDGSGGTWFYLLYSDGTDTFVTRSADGLTWDAGTTLTTELPTYACASTSMVVTGDTVLATWAGQGMAGATIEFLAVDLGAATPTPTVVTVADTGGPNSPTIGASGLNVALCWVTSATAGVSCQRSTDGGATFAAVAVATADLTTATSFSNPKVAVDENGALHLVFVAFEMTPSLYCGFSLDGATFAANTPVAALTEGGAVTMAWDGAKMAVAWTEYDQLNMAYNIFFALGE